jgi:hypothetical protein
MRTVLGVLAGIVVAVLCVYLMEVVGHSVFPAPPDIDPYNPAHAERLMAALPAGAFAFVLAGWVLGPLAGAWVANRIARQSLAGWIVAAFVICGGVYTMTTIPHPIWMWAAGIVLPIVAAWLAQRMTGSGTPAPMS